MCYNLKQEVINMLTEERFSTILELLQEKKAVTVAELTQILETSESTIRRDLNTLHEMGKLKKVHGGATLCGEAYFTKEEDVPTKSRHHIQEKERISRYAASLISDEDFIYIDAGTTTEHLIDYIESTKATFVTNGIAHAKKLVQKGHKAYVLGGQFKLSTEAIIGAEGLNNLKKYHFTKCFLGTNGITLEEGFSTPDVEEAMIKMEAARRSHQVFVLADHSKFGKQSSVSFASLDQAVIITDQVVDQRYKKQTVIREV